MRRIAPRAKVVLEYKSFFACDPPENRISIIKGISKYHIICEIVALNYRLKSKTELLYDNSLETQKVELKYFTKTEHQYNEYYNVIDKFIKKENDYPIIFNREACLFAIEEIINSDEIVEIPYFDMAKIEVWNSIFKYLISVNSAIIHHLNNDKFDRIGFEYLNPKLFTFNELSIQTDVIFTLYRGYKLLKYFLNNTIFSDEVKNYFKEIYSLEPERFVSFLINIYIWNSEKDTKFNFLYVANKDDEIYELLKTLSKIEYNENIFKLISVRKSPFIKTDDTTYLLSDSVFLIEKVYSQFLNDFWFDRIKLLKDDTGNSKFNYKFYRGNFGYFFEDYISTILRNCFINYKYSILLLFDELKVNNYEIADVYFRYDKKILIGQVKSGSIYDNEKYGGNIEILYKNNREKFFKDFGINQIYSSIIDIEKKVQFLDSKFPKNKSYTIYPCIIVNDRALQIPLMADVFNKRFQELLINFDNKKVKIKPLTIVHINDLERLEEHLNKNPKYIWDILEYQYQDKYFVPPFYDSLNRQLKKRLVPKRVIETLKSISLENYSI